ncbi:TetR/AcrR family transcriptional regulator [Actinopolymorpha alba]|uniref:TetR/AcrR family transcriptional regulator n=1 Tax=Actinopolymorpha alba TaxID=533267 RepID=UPI000364243A|nr:TetR/AcrR family transcriptional regulator [Actinopolymorpha alba]
MDEKLLDATVEVLAELGFGGVSLERVAERAGSSRVSLWRQGVTKEALLNGLLSRLAVDFRDTMWPVLTMAGTGARRLEATLDGLFDVIDRHLDLLAVSDEVFHWAADHVIDSTGRQVGFLDPVLAALEAGRHDETLAVERDLTDAAETLFNTACWGYVHLRARHRWSRARARRNVRALVLGGLLR